MANSRDALILENMLGADNVIEEPQSVIGKLPLQLLQNGGMSTGRNFQLVETVTISEGGVSTIERTGYDFTKVFIRGRLAAGESGTVQTLVGGFQCGWWAENVAGGVADTFAQIVNGMFFSEYGVQLTQAAGNNTTLARRELSYGQLVSGNITSVKITSSKAFAVGTTFEIYGV